MRPTGVLPPSEVGGCLPFGLSYCLESRSLMEKDHDSPNEFYDRQFILRDDVSNWRKEAHLVLQGKRFAGSRINGRARITPHTQYSGRLVLSLQTTVPTMSTR